jgi:hypothetical protein
MLADDALGVACLQGGFVRRPEFSREHRNERVAHDVIDAKREHAISVFIPADGEQGFVIDPSGAASTGQLTEDYKIECQSGQFREA